MDLTRRTFFSAFAALVAAPFLPFLRPEPQPPFVDAINRMLLGWRKHTRDHVFFRGKWMNAPAGWRLGTVAFNEMKAGLTKHGWFSSRDCHLEHLIFRGIPAIHEPTLRADYIDLFWANAHRPAAAV